MGALDPSTHRMLLCRVCAHLCTDILAPGERALNNACCHHYHDSWRASCCLQVLGSEEENEPCRFARIRAVGATDRVTKEWSQILYSVCSAIAKYHI